MNNNEIDYYKFKTYIEKVMKRHSEFLNSETIEAVKHYLDHDEFEMAFEGLFLDLMKIENFHFLMECEECKEIALSMNLDSDSVFDAAFWEKFLSFIGK